jgi:pyrroloquinoline quinone biosynthesis protein B
LHILVLGSAAGGGVPQWNCNGVVSRAAREGSPGAPARTQASIAVSSDGARWVLVNASPDLRQQTAVQRKLWPPADRLRGSPIEAVVLTGGEIDNVAGLLSMRESQAFTLWATERVLMALDANPMFEALDRELVDRRKLVLGASKQLSGPEGPLGITIEAFAVPGKVPLYMERQASNLSGTPEETIGLQISDGDGVFHFIPGCARITSEIRRRIGNSALLFFDGTLWTDDEMIASGLGTKTGQRMGHMSMFGPEGSIASLASLGISRRIFIHVNNSNPALLADSTERMQLEKAGWEVAFDGMEIDL